MEKRVREGGNRPVIEGIARECLEARKSSKVNKAMKPDARDVTRSS